MMSNYKHQKKHHGISGLPTVLHRMARLIKKSGNSHRKKKSKSMV